MWKPLSWNFLDLTKLHFTKSNFDSLWTYCFRLFTSNKKMLGKKYLQKIAQRSQFRICIHFLEKLILGTLWWIPLSSVPSLIGSRMCGISSKVFFGTFVDSITMYLILLVYLCFYTLFFSSFSTFTFFQRSVSEVW